MREIREMLSVTDEYEPNSEERKRHVMKIFDKMIEFVNKTPNQMKKYKQFFEAGLERAKTFTEVDSRFGKYVTEIERVMTKHDDTTIRVERELKRLQWTLLK